MDSLDKMQQEQQQQQQPCFLVPNILKSSATQKTGACRLISPGPHVLSDNLNTGPTETQYQHQQQD